MESVIVVMMKDKESGFLDKEITSLSVGENEEFIVNLFAFEDDLEKTKINLKLSTDRDVEDWEYSAIFDYYDSEVFKDIVDKIYEVEDCYNPTWEFIFNYSGDDDEFESIISEILEKHKTELYDVYNTIKDLKGEYDEKK